MLRLGLFTSLIVLAPMSKFPFIALPAYNFSSFRLGLYQIIAVIFVLICAIPAIKKLKSLYLQNKLAFLSIILLALVAIAGLFSAIYKARSALLAVSILFLLALVVAAWWYVKYELNKNYYAYVIKCLLIAGIVFSVLGVLQFLMATFTSSDLGILCQNCNNGIFGFPRVNGLAAEPQFYANALLPFFFIALSLAVTTKSRLSIAALSLVSLAATLTFSRGAFIAVFAGLVAFVVLARFVKGVNLKQLTLSLMLTALCVIAGFSLLLASASYAHRTTPNITYNTFVSMVDHMTLGVINIPQKQAPVTVRSNSFVPAGLITASTTDRLDSAELAIKAWRDNFYTISAGIGAGNLGPYVVNNIDKSAPSNLTVYIYYVLIVSELGVIGLMSLLILYVSGLWQFIKTNLKNKYSLIYMSIAATLAAFMVQYLFFGTYINAVYVWLWAGIVLGLAGIKPTNKIKSE